MLPSSTSDQYSSRLDVVPRSSLSEAILAGSEMSGFCNRSGPATTLRSVSLSELSEISITSFWITGLREVTAKARGSLSIGFDPGFVGESEDDPELEL